MNLAPVHDLIIVIYLVSGLHRSSSTVYFGLLWKYIVKVLLLYY